MGKPIRVLHILQRMEAGGTQELADELDTEQLGLESKIMAIRNFLEGPRPCPP